jgi:hypothetical protein
MKKEKTTMSVYKDDYKRLTKFCRFEDTVADTFKRIMDYYAMGDHDE